MKRNRFLFYMMAMTLLLAGSNQGCVKISESSEGIKPENLFGEFKLAVGSFFIDPYFIHRSLEVLLYEYKNEKISKEDASKVLAFLIREMEESFRYYSCLPYLTVAKDGIRYGITDDQGPVGGGAGYPEILQTGKYVVKNAEELVNALEKAEAGDVIFVPRDVKIDMTEFMYADQYDIKLKEGVTLASDRGNNGSKGGMIYTSAMRAVPFIQMDKNARVTGLRIQGPDAKERDWKNRLKMSGIFINGTGATVDNCEISGFNYAAIEIFGSEEAIVKNNYIHDCKSVNRGFGVLAEGAFVRVEGNLFNNLRVSIKGVKRPSLRLEIANNVDMGNTKECFLRLEKSKAEGTYNEPEGVVIVNNTLLSEAPAMDIKDFLIESIEFKNNHLYQKKEEYIGLDASFGESNAFGLKDLQDEKKIDDEFRIEEYMAKHTPEMRTANITARIYYCDLSVVHDLMNTLLTELESSKEEEKEKTFGSIKNIIRTIEGYDLAYDYLEQPYTVIDGEKYGAIPDDRPLGGGYGYDEIFTDGDYVVETVEEFTDALSKAKEGEVIFVKGNATIDLTVISNTLKVNSGVTIASDRGNGDSPGALIYCDTFYAPVFELKENVRITGMCIKGPDPEPRLDFHKRSFGGDNPKGHDYYFKLVTMYGLLTNYNGLQVDNCELAGFSTGAISISGESKNHHIHHNYIHHNQRNGLGYGVSHGKAISLIEYNLFDYNRHDIQGSGEPGSGYTARYNLQMGHSLSHCFDMHGGSDRKDGTSTAGENIMIYHNTFLSEKYPYLIRGLPSGVQEFYRNAVYMPLDAYEKGYLYGWNSDYYDKFIVKDNVFNLKKDPVVIP
jgi:hypothetical protein